MKDEVFDLSGHLSTLKLGLASLGGLELQTYFIVVSLAMCICLLLLVRRAENLNINRNQALDVSIVLMAFGLLGARGFHVIFEEPKYYLAEPIRIFEIWRGGFVWYGGVLIGGSVAVLFARYSTSFFSNYKKYSLGVWLDLFAPVCALGYALGRFACLLAGCCFGKICILESGFKYRIPTQLFASFWELGAFFLLLWIEKRKLQKFFLKQQGALFSSWIILHSIGRLIMESLRADPRGPELIGLSLASWISISLIAGVVLCELRRQRDKKGAT